ncbi:MAG: hypothetical protein KJ622_11730 [Alphaproteobacteria bacterium]|nr:hypothetical protein [Alphaproteobacteria bacterium]
MATNSAFEQLIVELINRARLDPAAEAARLGIGLNEGISGGSISSSAKQVLAANPFLVDAALGHSQWMLATDTFSHSGSGGSSPTQRMSAAGYTLSGSWSTGENIAWAGTTGSVNLAAYTQRLHDNLFKSAGHRLNILNEGFREIGVGELTGNFNGYNAAIVTENFARSGSAYFITGVAISDADGDEFYDIGEGRSGISVSVNGQGSDTTETAGGYKVAVSSGTHSVTFSGGGLAAAVTVTVAAGAANAKVDLAGSNKILSSADTSLGAGARHLSLLGVAALDGTGNGLDNTLRGNKGANTLDGLGGNDTIYGLAGNDTIVGGAGSDTVGYLGRRADFTITENADGSYTVVDNNLGDGINEGRDTIRGTEFLRFDGSGDTVVIGTSPPPEPEPEPQPGQGPEPEPEPLPPANGPSEGDDVIALSDAGGSVNALGGNDNVSGGAGSDIVRGGFGNDVISGLFGADRLFGDAGLDRLYGGDGDDQLFGNADGDFIFGGNGRDRANGGSGVDRIYGGNDDDVLIGGGHNDLLHGDNGNDRLFGNAGTDRLFGDRGDDRIDGGGGRDHAFFSGGSSRYDVDELANGNVRVTDLRGAEGVDLLIDVEVLHFADGLLIF